MAAAGSFWLAARNTNLRILPTSSCVLRPKRNPTGSSAATSWPIDRVRLSRVTLQDTVRRAAVQLSKTPQDALRGTAAGSSASRVTGTAGNLPPLALPVAVAGRAA